MPEFADGLLLRYGDREERFRSSNPIQQLMNKVRSGWTRADLVDQKGSETRGQALASYEQSVWQCATVWMVEICRALGASAPEVLGLALQRAEVDLRTILVCKLAGSRTDLSPSTAAASDDACPARQAQLAVGVAIHLIMQPPQCQRCLAGTGAAGDGEHHEHRRRPETFANAGGPVMPGFGATHLDPLCVGLGAGAHWPAVRQWDQAAWLGPIVAGQRLA